jgi:hypothetical protein
LEVISARDDSGNSNAPAALEGADGDTAKAAKVEYKKNETKIENY